MLIGIDGGGTHTRAVLADHDGRILGTGLAGSSNYNHVGKSVSGENLTAAVKMAWKAAGREPQEADSVFLGMAGVVNEADRSTIRCLVEKHKIGSKCGVDHDIRIALTGGLGGEPGIALIAGTGSACYGRNGAGDHVQVGGFGSLADDAGSASWMGRRALELAIREADGRCYPETELKKAVFDFLGIAHQRDFLHRVHVVGLSREEMARICPIVMDLYRSSNPGATSIVREGVAELSLLVKTAARLLGLCGPAVVLSGGVALSGSPLTPLLKETISESVPGAAFPDPLLTPAGGAALEAMRLIGLPITPKTIKYLKESEATCVNQ